MRVLYSQEARSLDDATISAGTAGITLMERAAEGVAAALDGLLRARPGLGRRIVVAAGTGNNGGDGFEVARLLGIALGRERVVTLLAGSSEKLRGDAALTFRRLLNDGGLVREVSSAEELEPLRRASLLVDAMFGTGLTRGVDPASVPGVVLAAMRESTAFTVSVDLPSGLDASSGSIPGLHVRASLTVTFGYPKRAHVELPAAGACGRVVVAGIGLTERPGPGPEAVTAADLKPLFPQRDPESHKGSFGTLAVVGGARGMAGAAGLAARAAHRAGAGKVTVLADPASIPVVHTLSAESTVFGWETHLAGLSAIAAGPGLGQSPEAVDVLRRVLAFDGPVLLDADALNLLAKNPGLLSERRCRLLLTPHLGEAARLLGSDTSRIRQERAAAGRELASRYDAAVIVKGFRSLCVSPGRTEVPVLAGNPGMATGGMGDALSGVCGALLARGLSPHEAAIAGAWLHGTAGDLALERRGGESVVASEVIEALPLAIEEVRTCRLP